MASSSAESKRSDTDETNTIESNSSDYCRPKFKFPPAPRLCKSANNTSCSVSCQSDSSISDGQIVKWKKRNRKKPPKLLPPIGVFWDIENCHVPKNKSASSIVQKIREIFFDGYREAEFIVVCDVKKENAQVIQDLHDAQVNLIHVSSTSKNAADEKLRQSLRRFAETHPAPAAVVLISGDINFAADLSDLRYRKKLHVILVHNSNVADALILCANETISYSSITENLPVLKNKVASHYDILITNLPTNYDRNVLKNRLKFLSDNCGGRVVNVDCEKGCAKLKFSSLDFAIRAQRRLKGEDVFGYKIGVSNPTNSRESPCRSYTGRKSKSADAYQMQACSFPSSTEYAIQESGLYCPNIQNAAKDVWKPYQDQDLQVKLNLSEQMFRPLRVPSSLTADQSWPSSFSDCRPSTPQDEIGAACAFPTQNWPTKFSSNSTNEQNKYSFQNVQSYNTGKSQSGSPIDLVISNLDPSIDIKELPKILTNLLQQYVMILNLNVTVQSDGTPMATVKVANQQEAQLAISHVHHFKLGYKKLVISYAQTENTLNLVQLREMIVALLQEVPGNKMPLFKLIDILESRYHASISVSEINKLKNICKITDDLGGRIISLTSEFRTSPQSSMNRISILYCSIHCPSGIESRGWGEAETSQLPNILMPLKIFSEKVNELLSSHMGTLPLLSFPICYKVEFSEPLPIDENGVPLEHLVTCVKNVELKFDGPNNSIKYIKREITAPDILKEDTLLKVSSTAILSNVQLLCREMVDLLKTTERCQLPLGRLIPAYHHHFGRQCRVADYGFTKLIDLLESQVVASVVQIIGYGTTRLVTLTHSTQMRRFTSDLLRVLKGQVPRQLTANEFPSAYEKIVGRPFNAIEYGLCNLEDLLDEVPDSTVVISKKNDSIGIAIPKREQTPEEIMRTRQFAHEAVKMLSYSPECSMFFDKFVPAYHHHFGHQCKVSDYGFTKLIELFEAIPDTVYIEETANGYRKVCLTLPRALKVLGEQIVNIIRHSKLGSLPLESLPSTYLREYGYTLKPQSYDSHDYNELISKISDFVQVTQSRVGPLIILAHTESNATISMRIWTVLLESPHLMSSSALINQYRIKFQSNISESKLLQLTDIIKVNLSEGMVSLTPFYILAAQLYSVLYRSGGQVNYSNLENLYKRYYNKEIPYSSLNANSLEDLIGKLNFMLLIRGSRKKTSIVLNQNLAEYGITLPFSNSDDNQSKKKEESSMQWPPPPAHNLLLTPTSHKKITPPKPDTPPTPGSAVWSNWNSPCKFNNSVDLSIPMPTMNTPKLVRNFEALISPTKNLLPAHTYQMSAMLSTITPPHPTEVPMPDKLLGKDDSNDSGVVSNSNIPSENEMDVSSEQTGAKPKQGSNLQTLFGTYNM